MRPSGISTDVGRGRNGELRNRDEIHAHPVLVRGELLSGGALALCARISASVGSIVFGIARARRLPGPCADGSMSNSDGSIWRDTPSLSMAVTQ